MINKAHRNTIEHCIKNLKLLFAHKSAIENISLTHRDVSRDSRKIYMEISGLKPQTNHKGSNNFVVICGLCKNADLYSLDSIYFDSISLQDSERNESFHLLEILAKRWSFVNGRSTNIWVYPVKGDHEGFEQSLWKNPERWDYATFILNELENTLKSGTLSFEIYNNFDKLKFEGESK